MLQPGELNHLYIHTHHLHFRRAISRFSAYGLGEGQPKLIRHLGMEDGLSQAELGRRCHLEPATVTVTLTRMEKAGLVERRPDPEDMRVTRVWLTETGREMHRELERLHLELEAECFAGFSDEEREKMQEFLLRMRDNLRSAEGAGCAGECERP